MAVGQDHLPRSRPTISRAFVRCEKISSFRLRSGRTRLVSIMFVRQDEDPDLFVQIQYWDNDTGTSIAKSKVCMWEVVSPMPSCYLTQEFIFFFVRDFLLPGQSEIREG